MSDVLSPIEGDLVKLSTYGREVITRWSWRYIHPDIKVIEVLDEECVRYDTAV